MKLFNLNFSTLILRFYLMMGIVIGAFFAGIPWLSFLALPIFFASMMGIEFKQKDSRVRAARQSQVLENASYHQTAH